MNFFFRKRPSSPNFRGNKGGRMQRVVGKKAARCLAQQTASGMAAWTFCNSGRSYASIAADAPYPLQPQVDTKSWLSRVLPQSTPKKKKPFDARNNQVLATLPSSTALAGLEEDATSSVMQNLRDGMLMKCTVFDGAGNVRSISGVFKKSELCIKHGLQVSTWCCLSVRPDLYERQMTGSRFTKDRFCYTQCCTYHPCAKTVYPGSSDASEYNLPLIFRFADGQVNILHIRALIKAKEVWLFHTLGADSSLHSSFVYNLQVSRC